MSDSLGERIQDLWLAARAAWPGVDLDAAAFELHVRERLAARDDVSLEALAVEDLYLACACARRLPGALETFERVLMVHVGRFIARVDGAGSLTAEVQQVLRERLFLGGRDGVPQIGTYQGRGPLLAWLRVAAIHAAFRLRRENNALAEVDLAEQEVAAHSDDLELEVVKAQHREAFQAAVADALRKLPQRDRNLLRLHLVGGVSTHKLAAMFHVGQSTIVRSLASAREAVRDATRARLGELLGMGAAELDSLAGLLLSQLDLSLGGCLRASLD